VVKGEESFWYLSVCSGDGLFRSHSQQQPSENGIAIKICAVKHFHVKASTLSLRKDPVCPSQCV